MKNINNSLEQGMKLISSGKQHILEFGVASGKTMQLIKDLNDEYYDVIEYTDETKYGDERLIVRVK